MTESEVIDALLQSFDRHQSRILAFVRSRASFEDWLTWEAYYYALERGWTAAVKPRYHDLGSSRVQSFADLFIEIPDTKCKIVFEF
ncbi:hypothetical protein TH25_20520 [Thalassospira profundimaris]|uniref:Uncharacterized protein n=1 Tax=Thalassospira profundimaris TaxID=502049 RepID=A0A367WRW7_9PROT|nr:hypothetical protein [Thalassospira profundimaris]RCK44117.1 hypothetical protein TH25_20520 [Thalassospira profundimaris]